MMFRTLALLSILAMPSAAALPSTDLPDVYDFGADLALLAGEAALDLTLHASENVTFPAAFVIARAADNTTARARVADAELDEIAIDVVSCAFDALESAPAPDPCVASQPAHAPTAVSIGERFAEWTSAEGLSLAGDLVIVAAGAPGPTATRALGHADNMIARTRDYVGI